MRTAALFLVFVACGDAAPNGAQPDAEVSGADAAIDASATPLAGFGDLAGMCGVLGDPDLTGGAPLLVRDSLTFARRYDDPADRPLLTMGGQRIVATPNAGGSSLYSEVFAFEQLARCELAGLVKTETEIVYDMAGKITDLLVEIDGYKIGVSVVRAVAYPFGSMYALDSATMLIQRKLEDIQASSQNVSAQDRWSKQVLAVLAWDDQHADTVMQAWSSLDASVRADTIVLVTTTHGDDTFIYSNL